MRATDIPIDDLRRKYAADPGSLTVDELSAIEKFKKIYKQNTPATPEKKTVTKTGKKCGRPAKPKTLEERIEAQRQRDLDSIDTKLDNNISLTASDRKMQADMLESVASQKSVAAVREIVQGSIDKRLQLARVKSFHVLYDMLDNSKREDVRIQAALALKKWADDEEPAPEGYTFVEAHPERENVTHIFEADKKSVPIKAKKPV